MCYVVIVDYESNLLLVGVSVDYESNLLLVGVSVAVLLVVVDRVLCCHCRL